MADLSEWLSKLKDYGKNIASDYMGAGQQAASLPSELAAKTGMMDQGRTALGMDPVAQSAQTDTQVQPALAPYEHVNPGYAPIGGASALRRTLAGSPPKLGR